MESMEPRVMVGHRLLLAAVAVMMALGFSMVAVQQAHATDYWDGSTAASFAGGTGAANDPYQIATGAQLKHLASTVTTQGAYAGKYFIQTDDIYLNRAAVAASQVTISTPGTAGVSNYSGSDTLKEWTPIGGGSGSGSFGGYYNGNGKTIYNIFYNHSDGSYASGNSDKNNAGLFGKVEEGAIVYNLTVSGGYFGAQRSVGAVVGKNWGSVKLCNNVGVYVFSNQAKGVGGIVGANWVNDSTAPVINGCKNTGQVVCAYSSGAAGGIAGENEGAVLNSRNLGDVTCPYNAGGIVGSNKNVRNIATPEHSGLEGDSVNSSIVNCYNADGATIKGRYAGGLAGYQACQGTNSYNKGVVEDYSSSVTSYVGELYGQVVSSASSLNDYLYYFDAADAVGTGTISGTHNATISNETSLCSSLNSWVGTASTEYYRWKTDTTQNEGWPIHDLSTLTIAFL